MPMAEDIGFAGSAPVQPGVFAKSFGEDRRVLAGLFKARCIQRGGAFRRRGPKDAPASSARRDGAPAEATDSVPHFHYEEFLIIPLRAHVLTAKDLPEINCHLSDGDITRILAKVNQVWHQAGIHWGLEKLVREPAVRTERFLRALDLRGEDDLGAYRILFPDETRAKSAVNVYFIHDFSVNGVWLRSAAVVKETARLKQVAGGIDEPIPRVLAHELGHALALPHRENRTNLMASGTTGTPLNATEVKDARTQAVMMPGAAPVAAIRRFAEEALAAGDPARARRLWTWLAEIPGGDEARKRIEGLQEHP